MNQNTARKALIVTATSFLATGAAYADELSDLRDRVAKLEAEQSNLTFGLPGTTVEIYGYAKIDFQVDLDSPLGSTIFGLANLDVDGPRDRNTRTEARQTRIGFRTSTETDFGTLKTVVEGDFFGSGGDAGAFRIRQAHGSVGGFLAGFTWTNFMPIESYPSTVDFQGPAGIPFARVGQVRYTHDFGNGFGVSGSIEDDVSADATRFAVTAAANYKFDKGFVKLAAISREFQVAGGDNVSGFGFNLSGNFQPWEGGTIQASFTQGDGIGSLMVFGGADVFAGEAVETTGLTLAVNHALNDKIRLGAAYGKRDIDAGALTDTEQLETVHLSAFYTPLERVTLGLEYVTGERQLFDGRSRTADRIIASAQFNF